jgi:hypothetical protein
MEYYLYGLVISEGVIEFEVVAFDFRLFHVDLDPQLFADKLAVFEGLDFFF